MFERCVGNILTFFLGRASSIASSVALTGRILGLLPFFGVIFTSFIFKGLVRISLILEDRRKTITYLPYNVHAQSKIVGRQRNKPVVNECGIPHICLPLSWSIFDVNKPSYYGPTRKRSHRKGNLNKPLEFVRFDNSLTIMHQPKGLLYMQWLKDMHRMETDSLKWWNGKGKEYVEFCSFDTLKRLFRVRFVKRKRGPDIFDAMGLTWKLSK
jgi:hypothetical protein